MKPSFVKTGMTDGLPVPPFAGGPDAVAEIVLRGIDRGTPMALHHGRHPPPAARRHAPGEVLALPGGLSGAAAWALTQAGLEWIGPSAWQHSVVA